LDREYVCTTRITVMAKIPKGEWLQPMTAYVMQGPCTDVGVSEDDGTVVLCVRGGTTVEITGNGSALLLWAVLSNVLKYPKFDDPRISECYGSGDGSGSGSGRE